MNATRVRLRPAIIITCGVLALTAITIEGRRVREFGFTESELERAKRSAEADAEKP